MFAPATGCEEREVILEYWLGGVVAILITVYLAYALVRPERF